MDITGTPIWCLPLAKTTSTVTINSVTNGVGPLTYVMLPMPTGVTQTGNQFSGLVAGDYIFQVTDSNGCTYQELYTIAKGVKIEARGQLIADMTCNTGNDGKLDFDVSSFSGNYTYTITKDGNPFDGSTVSTLTKIPLTGLGFGEYVINVSDNITLCTATASVTVARPTLVTLSLVSNIPANCTGNAQVQVAAANGTPGYTYAYVVSGAGLAGAVFSASDSASLNPATSTTWDFYAKDANGCISAALLVTITTDPLPAGFTATASQCPSTTGTYDITVIDGIGMAPYEYSIGSGFQTNPVFTVTVPKVYDLIVKDKFGCTTTFPAAVSILKPIVLDASILALPSCTVNNGSITATATGGSGNYSYQLGTVTLTTTPAVFNNLASGNQTIVVTDLDTNCTDTVTHNFAPATPITGFALTPNPVSCNGGSDGKITATMAIPAPGANDNPVYTYTLSGTDILGNPVTRGAQPSVVFANLPASDAVGYTVTVTSGRGCVATATSVVTEPALIVVPAPTVVQFGCTTGNTMNFATITVAGVTGGSGTYIYEFLRNGNPIPVQRGDNPVYKEFNLLGGSYVVNVIDSNSCVGSNVSVPPIASYIALDKINIVANPKITCTNPETITVSATSIGGTPTNLEYTLVDFNATTGVQGGVYPSQTNTNGVFTGLTVANYIITVKNLDTGCSIQDVHYVNEPNTFELKAVKTSDTCYGKDGGAATVTLIDNTIPSDDAGAFTYTVTGPVPSTGTSATAGPLNLTGLTAGEYTITATLSNSPFCSVSTTFTIDQPTADLQLVETHSDITCISGGSISVSATGGWPGGYEFQLELGSTIRNPWSSVSSFTGLPQGNYTVRVRDSKGCEPQTATIVNLTNPTAIQFIATPSTLMVSCKGDKNASITVTGVSGTGVTGGQGSNYLYTLNTVYNGSTISNGPQASPIFGGLGAGTYTVTVTDGWGCSATTPTVITITEPTEVKANLVMASLATCGNDATLTLSATGGTAPYTYSTDGTTYSASTFSTSVTIPAPVGTYRYYVKDANGCRSFVSNDVKIDPVPTLVVNLEYVSPFINCKDEKTGVIRAKATGGLGNYIYTLQDASGNPIVGAIQTTPGNFTQLVAGTYSVGVTSGDCNAPSGVVTITEPALAIAATADATDATCNGLYDGKIVVNATGGTGPYTYAISPNLDKFDDNNVFENLKPDPIIGYEIIAQDKNGCYVHITGIKIDEPAPVVATLDATSIIQEECFGDNNAAFSITISGGSGSYLTSLDDPRGPYVAGKVDFTGLAGGNHTVYVKDTNGCSSGDAVDVPLNLPVKLNPQVVVDNGCDNDLPTQTVRVILDPSINLSDVDFALDGVPYAPTNVFQLGNIFRNLTPGTHHITARHTNGCEVRTVGEFTIDQVTPLRLKLKDGGLNEIVATTTGGRGNYQYTLNGEAMGTQNKFIYYKSGDYTVTVTDENGCVATATLYFKFIDIEIPNVFTPNGDGDNEGWRPVKTENYPDLVFIVFDRYGRKVGTYRQGEFWDGKYEGKELPTGDYWYIIKLNNEEDSREFVGHFTLYR